MKKVTRSIIGFILCTCLLLPAIATSGFANTDEKPFVYSEELQERESKAIEIYNELLRYWAYDTKFICDVNANFPSFYGGAYINSDRNLVIQVTSTIDDARDYFSDMIDIEQIVFEEVRFSYAELKQQHQIIADKMNPTSCDTYISSITGVGISFQENSVMLYICTNEIGSVAEEFAKKVRDSVSSFSNISISFTSGMDTPCTDINPGNRLAYINSGSWYSASAGYWAYNGGILGIVTTGHTGLTSGSAIYDYTGAYSIQIGTIGTSFYGGSTDAAFVTRTNTSYTPSRFVPGHGFSLYSNSTRVMPEGALIYSRGDSSGHKTGTVLDTNYNGLGVSNCVLTNVVAAKGDSGGIVAGMGDATTRYVVGIISGMRISGNYMYYVKVNNVNSSLNTTVY